MSAGTPSRPRRVAPRPGWLRRLECRRTQRVLQRYLDGELGDARVPLVAAHLARCDRCGLDAALYEEVRRALRQLHHGPDRRVIARLRRFAAALADR